MLQLHNLKPSQGSQRRKKIRGRGDASGRGSYSGRGMKGQRSRAGVGGLAYLGMKHIVLATPKKRGFRSMHEKPSTVSISDLDQYCKDGDIVNPRVLLEKELVDTIRHGVKILSDGELTKKLTIENCAVSQSAREKIKKAGGTIQ